MPDRIENAVTAAVIDNWPTLGQSNFRQQDKMIAAVLGAVKTEPAPEPRDTSPRAVMEHIDGILAQLRDAVDRLTRGDAVVDANHVHVYHRFGAQMGRCVCGHLAKEFTIEEPTRG